MEYKLNFTSNIDEIISKAKELDKLVDNTDKSSKDAQKELLSTAENLDKELKSASKGILDASKAIRDMRKTARESGERLSEQEAASMLGVDLKALRSALKTYSNIAYDIRKVQESARHNIEVIDIDEENKKAHKILEPFAANVKKRQEAERKAYERELELVEEYKEDYENLMSKDVDLSISDIKDAKANKDFEALSDSLDDLTSYRVQLRNLRDGFLSVEDGASKFKNEIEEIEARLKSIQTPINQAQNVLSNRAKGTNGTRDSLASTGENIKNVTSSLRGIERDTEASVKRMGKSFSKLGDIIKSSFIDSLKTGATAVKKYFGLLAKAGKSIFNLIKKGFGGGSESSNPLINMFKKGIVFYGVKKLIGELQNFISTTANIGTVADSAFAQYNGHLASVKENLRTLGTIGATGLIQMLTPILNVLNFITSAAVNAAYAIADLLGFGGTARKAVAGYNAEAKAISGVGAAAKKATLGLQSFDKLNNTMSDKGSGGGGGGGISDAIEGIPYEDNKVVKWLKGLFDLLSDKKWQAAGEYVADGINSISDALYTLLKDERLIRKIHKFNDGLTDFFKGLLKIDTSKIGRNVGAGINIITTFVNDLYKQLSNKDILKTTGKRIAQFFEGLFDETDWTALGQALATKFRIAIDIFAGFIQQAQSSDLGFKAGNAVKEFLSGAIDRLFGSGGAEDIGKSIAGLINLAFDFIHGSIGDSETNKKIFEAIKTTITTAIQNIDASKMKDAAVDITNLIGDLLNTAADTISENTDAISGAIAGTVNGLADSGALSNLAKGITKFFLSLANLIGQTVTQINWLDVGSAILKGIGDAISENPEGMQFLVTAFSILFGVKLLAKLASFGISALATAIGNSLVSSIASKLGTDAAVSAVTGTASTGLMGLITKLGTAGIYAAAAAMGVSIADSIISGAKDKLTQLDNLADYTEKVWGERVTDTFDAANGKILFQAQTIGEYKDKLDELSNSFNSINLDIDGLGARGKKIDEIKKYLNKLEEAGMGANDNVEYLRLNIEKYDKLHLGSDKERQLALVEAIARDCNIEIGNSIEAVNKLDMSSLDNVGIEFSEFKVGTKFTDTELKMIEQSGETAGKTLGTGVESGVESKSGEIHNTIEDTIKVPEDVKKDAKTEGESIGKAIADGSKKGIEDNKKSFINALATIATAGLNMVKSIMGIHSPSKVFRDEVGQNIVLGMIEGISDEEMAVQDEMQNIRDVIMQPFDKRDMSEYFDFSGIPSSIVVNPSVNKARLQSGMESSGSTAGILGSLGMLGQKAGKSGQKVQVSVYLDANNKLGDFILDTVSGQVVKGGNF